MQEIPQLNYFWNKNGKGMNVLEGSKENLEIMQTYIFL